MQTHFAVMNFSADKNKVQNFFTLMHIADQ